MFTARDRGRPARRAGCLVDGPRARRRAAAVPLTLVASLALGLAGCGSSGPKIVTAPSQSPFDGIPATGYSAPNFTLRDQHGQAVTLSSERGKFVVLTFLYTHCKNVCPIIAGQLNQTLRDLTPAARSQVRVLAISVDPVGDTPAAVAKFIAEHRLLPQFLYLTGTAPVLEPIWAGYHIASTQTAKGLVVGHTAISILLDRRGQPQAIYGSDVTPAQVLHDLHVLGLQV